MHAAIFPDHIERVQRVILVLLKPFRIDGHLPFQAVMELRGPVAQHRIAQGGVAGQIVGVNIADHGGFPLSK